MKGNLTREKIEFDTKKVFNSLIERELDDRVFGAEINSFNKLIEKKDVYKENVHLIVTDTKDCFECAQIIKEVMEKRIGVKDVTIARVEHLSGEDIRKFETKGLRNLVNEVVKIIKNNNIDNISMLPIGGFKAEISLITTIANVFNIDSFYMYEGFPDVIKMPSLPINLQYDYVSSELDLFYKLKNNETIELEKEMEDKMKEKSEYKVLLSYEKIDDKKYLELTPFGLLFVEKLELDKSNIRLNKIKGKKIVEKDMTQKNNEPHAEKVFNDPKFKKLMQEILDLGYIEKIICNYYNPKNKGNQIDVKKSTNRTEGTVIKIVYNNSNGLGEVILITTARNSFEIDKIMELIEGLIKNS